MPYSSYVQFINADYTSLEEQAECFYQIMQNAKQKTVAGPFLKRLVTEYVGRTNLDLHNGELDFDIAYSLTIDSLIDTLDPGKVREIDGYLADIARKIIGIFEKLGLHDQHVIDELSTKGIGFFGKKMPKNLQTISDAYQQIKQLESEYFRLGIEADPNKELDPCANPWDRTKVAYYCLQFIKASVNACINPSRQRDEHVNNVYFIIRTELMEQTNREGFNDYLENPQKYEGVLITTPPTPTLK